MTGCADCDIVPKMSASERQVDLAKQLRRAIVKSGLNRLQLAKRSGVPYSVIHRFMAGNRDPALSTVTKLCRVLGLELRPRRKRARKG